MTALRYAIRTLRRSPWYSAAVIFVLGIGIALSTVVFAVVDGVLFKPLPYPRAHELFLVRAERSTAPSQSAPAVSFTEIDAWTHALGDVRLTATSTPYRFKRADGREYWGANVDEHFFDVIGMRPLFGGFAPEDYNWYQPEQGRAIRPVLVSYRYWQHVLGGDPNAIGRAHEEWRRRDTAWGEHIAGVLPPDFAFPLDSNEPQPEILSPIPRELRVSPEPDYQVVLRVPPSYNLTSLRARLLDGLRQAALVAPPEGHQRHRPFDAVQVVPAGDELGRHERSAFALVFCGATVLLMLACLNVAGLTVARNVERRRDLAVRRALGAGTAAIARGLLVEMALLAAGATAVALLAAKPILAWTIVLLPPTVTLLKTPAIDLRVFSAAALFGVMTVAAVALWPARVAARVSGASTLGGLATTATRVGRRSGAALIAAQVTLTFVLLTTGALTVASLAAAWRTDAGYRRDRMILVEAYIRDYATGADATEQLEQVGDLLTRIPGVDRVASSSIQPLFDSSTQRRYTELVPAGWKGDPREFSQRKVSADFFEVMGMRLISGRWPASGEWRVDQPVAIVSETAAKRLWPDRPAIGQLLVPESLRRRTDEPARTVIGVIGDTRYRALDQDPAGDIYVPDHFEPGRTGVFYHLRTEGDASASVPLVVQTLRARNVFANQVSTHEDALFASLKHRALPAWLFGSLGLAALLLSGVGILGLLAMSAAQRTRELGIRVALGATTGRVIRLLMGEQMSAVGSGLLAGAAISFWTVRFAESQLYGVRAYEPAVWSAVAAAVVAVAVVGTLVPSLRAARVNPVEALRAE